MTPDNTSRFCLRNLAVLCLMLLAAVAGFYLWAGSKQVWRSERFQSIELRGNPAQEERTAYPAVPTNGGSNYSRRWTTCLWSKKQQSAKFEIGSDDGSRLYIDGKLIINNWRDQVFKREQASILLVEGWHHLSLEYYQKEGNALISFRAWWEGERGGFITNADYHYPGNNASAQQLCKPLDQQKR